MRDRLVIQILNEENEEKCKELILLGLKERFGFIDHTLNPDLHKMFDYYSQNNRLFLTGFIDDTLVCTGALVEEKNTVGRIVRMSVKKEYRGRGIARRLLRELEDAAKNKGYRVIVIETNNRWKSALSLYHSSGYIDYLNDGDCTHMSKTI
ncbi:GNAT family N-acetyltransferase [Evansella halocellulosilytica]|uniref:GNAT family N-acetyltransferase n=1 Tax=Evansella halocellulosilytica TaxID=2011013 RepID=UPI000BB7E820|nr:GNAT family N-acetyltransferase [Evansella halocellulosilytica]